MSKFFLSLTLFTALIGSVAFGQTSTSFTAVGSMNSARYYQTATVLGNGKVLVTGGYTPDAGVTNTAELFDSASGIFTLLSSHMTSVRQNHSATLLPNGKLLIAGGSTGIGPASVMTNTAELFDPASGVFTAVPNTMSAARSDHTATLLPNGKVLIAGGGNTTSGTLNTAELFDPASGTFTSLPLMTSRRDSHTATLLPNGKVLIAGGYARDAVGFAIGTNTAELFDPGSGTFTLLANTMTSVRYYHTATLLSSGKVLITGGYTPGVTDTAELFDPVSGTFTAMGSMNSARSNHTATLLPSGKVLIAGGYNGLSNGPLAFSNTAELFDPTSGTFTSLLPETMNSGRSIHAATLLPSGRVLIAGGYNGSAVLNTAELFDGATPTFTSLSPNTMNSARERPTATLLPSGKVLIAGGYNNVNSYLNTAELFNPATGTFTSLPLMNSARYAHTATLLPNGKVLIAGGTGSRPTNAAELFDPSSGTFMSLPPMTSARVGHSATLLSSGKVLIVGGENSSAVLNTAELFDPNRGTFTSVSPNTLTSARSAHSATLLPSGKVLIAGGYKVGVDGFTTIHLNTAELFDPITETFTSLSPNTMTSAREAHTATLLPSGKILIAGGYDGSDYTNKAELFDPASSTFTALPPMTMARYLHTATLLSNGTVLITGGFTRAGIPSNTNTAELFDPASGTFTSLLPNTMSSARAIHAAALLPGGKVLIAGGVDNNSLSFYLNTAELFDPGLGFSDERRPLISAAPDSLLEPASLVLTGSGFRGDSEAAGGSFQSSATNYPIVQLMRIDNEQTFFVLSDPATNWSDTTFSSETLGLTTSLPTGQYRVTVLTNAIPSFQKIVHLESSTPPVPLASVVSRKAHGDIAVFDIALPISGPRGIECRSGGANGNYTIIFTFANTLSSVTGASVTSGTGTVNSSGIGSDPHQYIVSLTGVTNAQTITVSLTNVTDAAGNSSAIVSASMGVLLGDTTADRSVNSADISQTKSQSGQAVTGSNFRQDVTVDGSINSADISLVKSKSGTALP